MSKGIRGERALALVESAISNPRRMRYPLTSYQRDMISNLEETHRTAVIDFPPMVGKTLKSNSWTKEDKETMISGLTEIQELLAPIVERATKSELDDDCDGPSAMRSPDYDPALECGCDDDVIDFTPEPTVRKIDMRDVTITARYEVPKSLDDLSDIEKDILR